MLKYYIKILTLFQKKLKEILEKEKTIKVKDIDGKVINNVCPKRYHCRLNKQYYDAKFAQDQYAYNLKASREGIFWIRNFLYCIFYHLSRC